MADCEFLPTCIFYNDKMASKPATAEMFKKRYCRDDFPTCARYRVVQALGRGRVPTDLYPNDSARADTLIKQG